MSTQQVRVKVRSDVMGLLLVAFIVLKLTGIVDWSWWWVMAPLWGPLALFSITVGIVFVAVLLHPRKR